MVSLNSKVTIIPNTFEEKKELQQFLDAVKPLFTEKINEINKALSSVDLTIEAS